MLIPHVARLTKADEVRPLVSLDGCGEIPKRSDVVNGQTRSNMLSAFGASAFLLGYDREASVLPSPAPVRLRATNPKRGRFARLILAAVFGPTSDRAESGIAGTPLVAVADLPRLQQKRTLAAGADKRNGRNPKVIRLAGVVALSETPRVGSRRFPDPIETVGVLAAEATPRTKPLAFPLRSRDQHNGSARFARLRLPGVCAHSFDTPDKARRFNGAGTTGLVAQEHNRQYIGIELNAEYIAIAARRLSQGVLDLGAA